MVRLSKTWLIKELGKLLSDIQAANAPAKGWIKRRDSLLRKASETLEFPPLRSAPENYCCWSGAGCACGREERSLRWFMEAGRKMTPSERLWCLKEIWRVEGWDDYRQPETDFLLANDVLSAWLDYARDKCEL